MASKRRVTLLSVPCEEDNNSKENLSSSLTGSYPLELSILKNSNNIRIEKSLFNITTNTTNVNMIDGHVLDIIYERVAPNAILNSGGRADEVRCHPGTRAEVISVIERWISDAQNGLASPIFWLSGPAGGGKTAIVQTIAEQCKQRGVPHANFFFFRADHSRNNADSFVPTLLYQLLHFYPPMREAVSSILLAEPLVCETSLQEQLDLLLYTPFRSMHQSSHQPFVLLIDGLDECDWERKTSQRQILQALGKLVAHGDMPVIVLVASRAEPQIIMSFNQLASPPQSIFLDDKYCPEDDIRLFVTAEFEKIRAFHPHATLLDADWPSEAHILGIVRKSSGQFIYAATVMRFIAHSSAVPSLSLERVQGVLPATGNGPFSHLDAVYMHILNQAADRQATRDILASKFLDDFTATHTRLRYAPDFKFPTHGYEEDDDDDLTGIYREGTTHAIPPIKHFLNMYHCRYTWALLVSVISDLAALVELRHGRLVFHHASLVDFLRNASRSKEFYINIDRFTAKVVTSLLEQQHQEFYGMIILWPSITKQTLNALLRFIGKYLAWYLIPNLKRTTSNITNALLAVDLRVFNKAGIGETDLLEFLVSIARLYYPRDASSYKRILRQWITWAVNQNIIYNVSYSRVLKGMVCDLAKIHNVLVTSDVIPYRDRYILMATLKHRASRIFKNVYK
ncbi:hypothetical protein D9619_012513 [Psilocybe cf. subviscida]|uniref:NACHT domain-containing protein n=1 Tax=Psilocybe cf. subviscida TaxID=2480587 RepID=A0A8H5B6W4_9AGAR|nr:hypothetical protein D9619_012513 [Psilocybe cf. subviscida]